jgi:hypothetical protein
MATLYVAEFNRLGLDRRGNEEVPIAQNPPVAEQTVAMSGTSAQSNAFSGKTTVIRVHTDAVCSILIGTNPTATAAKMRLAADQTEYFGVLPGDKIAVITNT